MKKNTFVRGMFIFISILAVIATAWTAFIFGLIPTRFYKASDFDIKTVKSDVDFNSNGIDDYTDFLLGARKDAENRPEYDGSYFASGYPPENKGVCTDVVWRAFREAGYSLRAMVDRDIESAPESYINVKVRDNRIDFRRVQNLKVFFERNAVSLTTDTSNIKEWQPGDIVIFDNTRHIGIVSDKRDSKGRTYIIHNAGQPVREENYLARTKMKVTGHYRFDASLVKSDVLEKWID